MDGMPNPMAGGAPSLGGLNPDMLKNLIPQMTPFLAGMGFTQFTADLQKLVKTMSGGAHGNKHGQQPTGTPAQPGQAASGPQAAAPPDAQQLMILLQLLKARGMGGGM